MKALVSSRLFQDIRNFFSVKTNGKGTAESKAASVSSEKTKKRPKPVVLSSDSEEEVGQKKKNDKAAKPAKKPAKKAVLSDSGELLEKISKCLRFV